MHRLGIAATALLMAAPRLAAQGAESRLAPRLIQLDSAATGYTEVLGGPPATITMRSGQVVLAPRATVGRHSTERYEELVVVLAGAGEMRVVGGATLALRVGTVAYCPPATEHDVVNTGPGPLRYLYVVARAP
jgi:mannose-6-phosphate isomerase-like protein (cupin superfamily)